MKSHTLFCSGKENGIREFGVVFVVDRAWKGKYLTFKAINERIHISRIKTKFHNLSFINVHASTKEKDETDKKAFLQKMEEAYDICSSSNIKVLLRDLNAKTRREEIYWGLIRRHSINLNTNNNGQTWDFTAAKNVVVSSTCYPHQEIHKLNWGSPDGKTNNPVDHIQIE